MATTGHNQLDTEEKKEVHTEIVGVIGVVISGEVISGEVMGAVMEIKVQIKE